MCVIPVLPYLYLRDVVYGIHVYYRRIVKKICKLLSTSIYYSKGIFNDLISMFRLQGKMKIAVQKVAVLSYKKFKSFLS